MGYQIQLNYSVNGDGEGVAPATLKRTSKRSKRLVSIVPASGDEGKISIEIDLGIHMQNTVKHLYGLFWEDGFNIGISVLLEQLLEEAFLGGMEFQRQKDTK